MKSGSINLWDIASGQKVRSLEQSQTASIAFSPDSKLLASGSMDESAVILWEIATGRKLWTLYWQSRPRRLVSALAFSPDGKLLAAADLLGVKSETYAILEVATGRKLSSWRVQDGSIKSLTFSSDGRLIAGISKEDKTIRIWESATGNDLRTLKGHTSPVVGVAFIAGGEKLVSGSSDGMTKIWDVTTGRLLVSSFTLGDDGWVVVTPDGRFDTNQLDVIKELHWILPEEPMRALPLEIFMRDYYEPRLLERLLSGEPLPPAPSLPNLNRVQPLIRITEVKPQEPSPGSASDAVTVTVEIISDIRVVNRDGKQVQQESGVYDMRLFRDGQMVRSTLGKIIGAATVQETLVKRNLTRAIITIKDVKLPRRADLKQVEFSAYAFNADHIKSNTAHYTYVLPQPLPTVKGGAFIIAVGVNAYEDPALDLGFAANDARRLQAALTDKLKASGEYEEVVPITLLSDYDLKDKHRTVIAEQATKGNVKSVLDLLAGGKADSAQLVGIPNVDKLQQARPEDLVIFSFAGHGYADETGQFYLVTYDTGTGAKREVTPALLQKSISSDELSLWLRNVDAGELIMIVDACQSAAAVQGAGFKPGPMGSRGLGQLAYDKGMRILAATQADNVALENKLIQQGLLTYALTHDGIDLGRADFKPEDKTITLREWLAYGAERVPQLFEEVRRGQVRDAGQNVGDTTKIIVLPSSDDNGKQTGSARLLLQGKPVGNGNKMTPAEEQIQRPALFDFSRSRRDVLLLKKK